VLASAGYPGKFENGKRIEELTDVEKVAGVKVLHAGTKRDGDSYVTNGGRVLGVTATGASLDAALAAAYQAIGKIHFDGMHYRKDIGIPAERVQRAGN
jgi:phosphoribosylamine--glycine ligase